MLISNSMLFVAKSLRDQLRLAREAGVSMDCVPTPREYDEDENVLDPDADIRFSRFDRADGLVEAALIASSEKAKASANKAPVAPPEPDPVLDAASASAE